MRLAPIHGLEIFVSCDRRLLKRLPLANGFVITEAELNLEGLKNISRHWAVNWGQRRLGTTGRCHGVGMFAPASI